MQIFIKTSPPNVLRCANSGIPKLPQSDINKWLCSPKYWLLAIDKGYQKPSFDLPFQILSLFFYSQSDLASSHQHTPTHKLQAYLQLNRMIESILSLICWVWLPALLYHCIIRSRGSSPGFMNELTLRQRLGDGTDPTVMSCHRQGEERELYETSHSLVSLSLSRSFFFFLPTPHPTQSPITHPRCFLAIFPSPVPPCPSVPIPAQQTLALAVKIPISHPRSGAQAKTATNLVCICIYVFM